MLNNDLLAQGEQFPDDFFQEPQTPSEQFPDDFFDETTSPPRREPDVEAQDKTPGQYVKSVLFNIPSSTWQNVWDTISLLRPWGKRASGETTAIPGVADLARLFSEAGHKSEMSWNHPLSSLLSLPFRAYTELDERFLGGMPQEGRETPLVDSAVDYFAGRYDFTKPEVRDAFAQVVEEDPVGVLTDIATVVSLGSTASVGGARAAAGIAKGAKAATRAGLGTAAKAPRTSAVASRVSAGMDKILGGTERVNIAVNGGFHVTGVPGKTPEMKLGLANAVDPTQIALYGGLKGVQAITRALSPYAPKTPDAKARQQAQRDRLERQGFDASPMSLISENPSLQGMEISRINKEYEPIINDIQKATEQLNVRVREILDEAHTDGDLERAAVSLAESYTETQKMMDANMAPILKQAGIEPGLIIDLRPVYRRLQRLRHEEEAATRLLQTPETQTPFSSEREIRTLYENVEQSAEQNQNRLSPEFLSGEEQQATQPVGQSGGQTAKQVEDALHGTPTREAVDASTGETYSVTYRLMELDDILTSHDVDGVPVPAYDARLQVKDMSQSGSRGRVIDLASNLLPELVLTGRTISSGTPILNRRQMSISGNHRLNALRVARQSFPNSYQAYVDELKGEVGKYGYSVDDVNSMNSPALVRVLDDDVDEIAFARAANVSETAPMSDTEQALQDTHILTSDMLDLLRTDGAENLPTTIARSDNLDFRNTFINKLPPAERQQFVGQGADLLPSGLRRIVNAVRAKVFSGPYGDAMRGVFTENPVRGFRNMQRGIDEALPALVALRQRLGTVGEGYDVSEPLAEAFMKIQELIKDEESGAGVQRAINTYLGDSEGGGQQPLQLGVTPDQEIWMRQLDARGRSLLRLLASGVSSPRVITDVLRDYSDMVTRLAQPGTVPSEEILTALINDKLGGSDSTSKLLEGMEDFFLVDDEAIEPPPTAPTSTTTPPPTPREPTRPILYENLSAYRDTLLDALEKSNNPQSRNWKAQVISAIDDAIMLSAQAANLASTPFLMTWLAGQQSIRNSMNSDYGRLITSLVNDYRKPSDPDVQRAMQTIFTPADSPRTIRFKYSVIGGFDSEAGQRVRRAFLGNLFDFVHTKSGQADAAAIARGEQPIGDISTRYDPQGVSKFLNAFKAKSTDYPEETLRVILGNQTVDDLNDLDMILQHFGTFMQSTRRNNSFFDGEGRTHRSVMQRVAENLGWRFVTGAIGGAGGNYVGGALGATIGAVGGFLFQWIGEASANIGFRAFYSGERGRNILLDGIELAMRDAWRRGLRVIVRGARPLRSDEKNDEDN